MNVKEAIQELAEEVKQEVLRRLQKYGTNPRTGSNTLVGSDLEKSIEVKVTDDGFVFQIASYFEYVVRGWKRTGNYPGTMSQFVENLTQWVRKKGIRYGNKTENQVVWAILKSIWMRGIAPRPFLNWDDSEDPALIIPFLDDYFDEWSDKVFEDIISELDKYFNE